MLDKFFRNAVLIAGAEMVARAKGLILLPILSRHLDTAAFGVWSQVAVLVFTLSPLVALGSENGVIRLLPGLEHDRQCRQFTAWLIFVAGSALVIGAAIALGRSWLAGAFFGPEKEYEHFLPLAALGLVATALLYAGRMWLLIRGRGRTLAAITLTQAVLTVGAVSAVIVLNGSVYAIVAAGIAADLVAGFGVLALIPAQGGMRRPDFAVIGPALRFGLPFLPAAYAMWGLNWMDRLFLVHYRGLGDIGLYTVAYSLGFAVIQMFVSPIWVMYPSAATELHNRSDHSGMTRLLHATSGTIVAITLPAIAGLWALDTPIIRVIAGPGYVGAAPIMPIIALAYFFTMMASFPSLALGFAYRQRLATLSIGLAAGVNLILNIALIPQFGVLGAASATALAFAVQFLVTWRFAAQKGPFWNGMLYPVKIAIAAAGMAALTRMLNDLLATSDVTRILVLVPTAVFFYIAFSLLLGTMPAWVTSALRQRLAGPLRPRSR